METLTQLVQTTTSDNLILSGLYSKGSTGKEAIIFIHGFGTDFFTHKFTHSIGDILNKNNYAYVLAQNRGTGLFTEFISADRSKGFNLGSYYEKIDDAHLDISSWVDFLRSQGYTKFILVGHSLGTIKSVRYLYEGEYIDQISKLILLAPFDKNGYVENKTKGEWHNHIKIAEEKIREGKALEIIPNSFDDFPMTYQNYLSWYKESDLNSMFDFYKPEYISPVLQNIKIPVQVILGDKDTSAFTPEIGGSIENTVSYLRNSLKKADIQLIADSDHCYVGYESEVANNVIKFLE
ncbi:MAG: alpha/beta hydrolase [Candidatus Dojkabacteria bacterium]